MKMNINNHFQGLSSRHDLSRILQALKHIMVHAQTHYSWQNTHSPRKTMFAPDSNLCIAWQI